MMLELILSGISLLGMVFTVIYATWALIVIYRKPRKALEAADRILEGDK